MVRNLLLLAAIFLAVTGVAELLGAANLGTAATAGQVAVIAAATLLIVRGRT